MFPAGDWLIHASILPQFAIIATALPAIPSRDAGACLFDNAYMMGYKIFSRRI